jgi:hypothetical protein
LPKIIVDGKQYVEEAQLEKEANAKRTSLATIMAYISLRWWVMAGRRHTGAASTVMRSINHIFLEAGSTGNFKRHSKLHRQGKPSKPTGADDVDDAECSSSRDVLGMPRLASKWRKRDVPIVKNAGSLFKLALIKWIIDANYLPHGCGK